MVPHNENTNRIYLFETCLTPILNDVSLDHDYNASGGSLHDQRVFAEAM